MDDDASLRVTVTAIGQHTSTPNSSIAEISPSLHEYQHQRPSNNVSLLDDFASVALRHSSLSSPQGISSPQPSFRVGTSPGRPGHQKDLPCEDETLSLYAGHSEPEAMILSGASVPLVLDEFAINPRFVELQRELRSLLFTSAHSNAPTRAASPVVDEHPGVSTVENRLQRPYQAISSESIKQIVSTNQRLVYLKNYIVEVAPWLDMHDVRRTFGNQLLILAQTSSPLVYAILAISARQIERKQGLKGSYESLQLYQNAIELLTPQLEARDPNIMATCVVLCCLEMMSASPTDWRRHLDGCAALFDSFGIHGFSGGLLQAVFWCYARMDLCFAIIAEGEESVVLSINKWLPPHMPADGAGRFFRSTASYDMHANYAVFLCARVCCLLSARTLYVERGQGTCGGENFTQQWLQLWDECTQWAASRPKELLSLAKVRPAGGEDGHSDPFPHILYSAQCAISGNQLYHTACILLLDIVPPTIDPLTLPSGSKLWHARRVCGISMTNIHHGCWNLAIHPLWVAGRLLSHRDEHRALVRLIERIEATTGWGICWRIKDLKEAWGYEQSVVL